MMDDLYEKLCKSISIDFQLIDRIISEQLGIRLAIGIGMTEKAIQIFRDNQKELTDEAKLWCTLFGFPIYTLKGDGIRYVIGVAGEIKEDT